MENKRSETKHNVSEDLICKSKSINNIKHPQNNIDKRTTFGSFTFL